MSTNTHTAHYSIETTLAMFSTAKPESPTSTVPLHSRRAISPSVDVNVIPPVQFVAEFAAFQQHRDHLMVALRKAAGRRSLDKNDAWCALTRVAHCYFLRTKGKEPAMRPARRVARLRDLATALHKTSRRISGAMRDEVGFDLLRGWCKELKVPMAEAVVFKNGITRIPLAEKLTTLVTELSTLEAAAKKAAGEIRTPAGAPSGAGILTDWDVFAMQALYRRYTGKAPLLRAGPFADFVQLFLNAVGRTVDTKQDYVVEAFKYFNRKLRKKVGQQTS